MMIAVINKELLFICLLFVIIETQNVIDEKVGIFRNVVGPYLIFVCCSKECVAEVYRGKRLSIHFHYDVIDVQQGVQFGIRECSDAI